MLAWPHFWNTMLHSQRNTYLFQKKMMYSSALNKRLSLKVRQSQNDFFKPMFPPKKETNKFYFTAMKPQVDLFWFFFWRKLKTPKRHFETNGSLKMRSHWHTYSANVFFSNIESGIWIQNFIKLKSLHLRNSLDI